MLLSLNSFEPMCVLGYDYHFKDIARFCFNLGEFYDTPTSYKNLLLYNVRDNQPSLFIGPTLVHMTRGYSAYCHLASKLKEEEPDIGDIRSVVTDGEVGLCKALKVFYPDAVKLRCTKHFVVMVMVLITYYNSYIQLNYHMFTSNIGTITTVLNSNIYLHCQIVFYIY